MWISSFVVTLPDVADQAGHIKRSLAQVRVFELGAQQGRRLPVVLECEDAVTARDWHEWVVALPGVVSVDVAMVSFEPERVAGLAEAADSEKTSTDQDQVDVHGFLTR